MELRSTTKADFPQLPEIDGTIESSSYLHVQRAGDGLIQTWSLAERPLQCKLIRPNPMDDATGFALRQVLAGIEEGLALVAEHEGVLVASLLACPVMERGVLRLVDLRVDSDYRRQGLGMALVYRAIQDARERGLRAVSAQTLSNNVPGARLLLKTGFDLAGLDAQWRSNHDLVKEEVALLWYAALD